MPLALGPLPVLLVVECATVSEGGTSKDAKGGRDGNGSPTATTTSSPSSAETTVDPAFAEAELRPVGPSGTYRTAVSKAVGSTDVQVELGVSGQPTKDPDTHYFAQVHEGSYSDKRSHQRPGEGHEEHSVGADPTLALVRFDPLLAEGTLLAKAAGPQARQSSWPAAA